MSLPTRISRATGYDSMDSLHRDFDSMIRGFFGGRNPDGDGAVLAPFAVDVREDGDHLYVIADLPGFTKEDVDITLENHALTINAQRKSEKQNEVKGEWLLNERRSSRFLRSFNLPPTVSDQSVDAKLADGVLTIKLSKREETKPRKISVS